MTQKYHISGMTCNGCVSNVQKTLAQMKGVESVEVELATGIATLKADHPLLLANIKSAMSALPYQITEGQPDVFTFWKDGRVWKRASFNTLNCLIGCSLGDFAMVIYLQAFYPGVSMTLQMILATAMGLVTSVLFETTLLHFREKFSWSLAIRTAFSMSFISMIAMEVVMNATDFMMTGGKAAFQSPMYWTALAVAMIAGFMAPLPYNYYKLKKFNKACH